jgi:hypothetical protein
MQDIYNYIPGTIHASKVYSIAAILTLQFMVHVTFCYYYYYYYYYYYWGTYIFIIILQVYILICLYSVNRSILLPNMLNSSVLFIKVSGLLLRIDVSLLEVVSKKDVYFVFSSN